MLQTLELVQDLGYDALTVALQKGPAGASFSKSRRNTAETKGNVNRLTRHSHERKQQDQGRIGLRYKEEEGAEDDNI